MIFIDHRTVFFWINWYSLYKYLKFILCFGAGLAAYVRHCRLKQTEWWSSTDLPLIIYALSVCCASSIMRNRSKCYCGEFPLYMYECILPSINNWIFFLSARCEFGTYGRMFWCSRDELDMVYYLNKSELLYMEEKQ